MTGGERRSGLLPSPAVDSRSGLLPSPAADRPVTVLVLGTGTEVGKTWVGAAVARELRTRGRRVLAHKPAQSFDPGDDAAGLTDAHVLAAATGQEATGVCPPRRWYPRALAPPMAAEALGLAPFTIADLLAEVPSASASPGGPAGGQACDVLLVETAGGVRSPLASDGDALALAARLDPSLAVLVADPGLGTINAVRLAADALAGAGRPAPVVFLNRFSPADALHAANRDWLRDRDGLCCLTEVADLAGAIAAASGPARA